jgi:amidase
VVGENDRCLSCADRLSQNHPQFGWFSGTDYFDATPPVKRAVDETVEALRKAGHEVVEFPVTNMREVYLTSAFFFSAYDGALKELLKKSGEPLIPGLQGLFGDKPEPNAAAKSEMKSMMARQWENFGLRDKGRQEWLDRFNAAGLDGVICPVIGIPSCKHFDSNRLGKAAAFSTYFNVLDLAVGTLPVTKVRMSDKALPKGTKWKNYTEAVIQESVGLMCRCRSLCDSSVLTLTIPQYTPEAFLNCPVSVQVVGRRWKEEEVIELMYAVDDALKVSSSSNSNKTDH